MTKTNQPTIPCQCCRGTAREPLPADYLPTLTALRKFAHGATGADLRQPMTPSAQANQLARLEKWGLIQRIGKKGKAIVWLASFAPPEPPKADPKRPVVRPCLNCGELPEWRRNGRSQRHRLVHSTGTCPNRVVVVHDTDAKVAQRWNVEAYAGKGGQA